MKKSELFFKNLASLYAEKSGNELKKELDNLNNSYDNFSVNNFDKKIKSRIRAYKIKKWTSRLMPVAACFLILFIAYITLSFPYKNLYNNSASDSDMNVEKSNEILNFEFVSKKLPNDYTLRKIDYDYHKVIYYILNDEKSQQLL